MEKTAINSRRGLTRFEVEAWRRLWRLIPHEDRIELAAYGITREKVWGEKGRVAE